MSIDIQSIESVTPETIDQYLRVRGWKLVPQHIDDQTRIYNSPKVKYAQVEVPIKKTVWFLHNVQHIIRNLAGIEQREEEAILTDLLYSDCDVVRYHAVSPQFSRGTISIGAGCEFIEAISDTIQAAYSDAVGSAKRTKRTEIESIRENVLLDQTERGSYIVKILCPLNALGQTLLHAPGVPMMRETTKNLMRIFANITDAVDRKKLGKIIDTERKENAVSRINVYSAIAKTQLTDDGSMDLDVRWAPSLKMTDSEIPNAVHLTAIHFSGIAEIISALTPKNDPKHQTVKEKFIAVVDECKGDFNDQKQREGTVLLRVFSSDGRAYKAKAILPHELYMKAYENHGLAEGHFIEIVGYRIVRSRIDEIVEVESINSIQ